jgi:hypothetical protein
MTVSQSDIPEAKIAELCRRYGIRKLALFGSVLSGRFNDSSDIDILVDFRPRERDFFRLAEIEDALGPLLGGRKIDLRTPWISAGTFAIRSRGTLSSFMQSPEAIRLRHMRQPGANGWTSRRTLPVGQDGILRADWESAQTGPINNRPAGWQPAPQLHLI